MAQYYTPIQSEYASFVVLSGSEEDVCTPMDSRCVNGYYQSCNSEGQWEGTSTPCGGSENGASRYLPYIVIGGFGLLVIGSLLVLTRKPK
jgi:hypothetical protein